MAPVVTNLDGELSYYIKKSNINESYIDIEIVASSLRWKNFDIELEYRPDNESEWQTDTAITFTSTNMMVGNRVYDLSASNIGTINLIRWNYSQNGLHYGVGIQVRIKVLPRIRNFGFLLTTSTISEIYGENNASLISFKNNRRCISINKGGQYICLWVDSISIYDSLTDTDPIYYFSGLSFPTYAAQINNGHYIICDTNNNRVMELSEDLSTVIYTYNITSPIFFDYDNTNSLCLITNSSGVNEVSLVSSIINWTSTIVSSNIKSATYSLKNNDEIIISDYQNSKIILEDRIGGIIEERDSYKININSDQVIPFYHPYRAYRFDDGSLVVIEEDGKIVDFNYVEELMSSSSSES